MIYIFLAQGFEEVEAIATIDVLRRAKLTVQTVGIGTKTVTGSHGISVNCDCDDREVSPNDEVEAIVLPGGMPGTENLEKSSKVQEFVDFAYARGILICAICAAPIILGHKGLLKGKEAICFPGYESELAGAIISEKFVCKDGLFITAKGMGAAIEFGLEIAKNFIDGDSVQKIRESLQCP